MSPAPVTAPEPAPPARPTPTVLLLEALLSAQPDQTTDDPCNRGQDCPTAARSSLAGGLRFTYDRPGIWSATTAMTFGHASDQERRPPEGYDTFQLRVDLRFEINRGRHRFGLAFRVSPVLVVGWSDTDTTLRTDIPGLGLLLGRSDLWVEIGVPTLPTHDDPRFLSLVVGWRQPLFTLEGGIATFTSLTWARGALDRTGLGPGVWLTARTRFTAESRLEASLRLALADVSSLVIGLGYHFGDVPLGAFE
ncbi:MAG: hypothetical protein CVU56_23810 [Deltaproteobacteria bacterium HGW-Deltaproteobacteria-14]|nr:MAG: hypothetical protein CVU56_23810 [Deltaproteobacteria bacterium HGW-Deltaproteobacteria-14]